MRKTSIHTSEDILTIAGKIGLNDLMKKIIVEVERGFVDFFNGKLIVPKREGLYFNDGLVEVMPIYNEKFVCYKIGSVYKNNAKLNLPSTLAHLILLDRRSGYPIAFIEDTLITALRTGAASAVATKYLANLKSENVGIIGAGVQAYTQLHAMALILLNLKRAYVYDKDFNKSKKFVSEYKKLGICGSDLEFSICSSPQEVCQKSEVIITSTTKSNEEEPVVKSSWVRPGTHINAIGTDIPKPNSYTEIEIKLLKNAKVVVDYAKQALKEGESQNLTGKEIYAELGEIVSGKKSGRTNAEEITIFDSTGVAFQDFVSLKPFLEHAKKFIEFSSQNDIANPYK